MNPIDLVMYVVIIIGLIYGAYVVLRKPKPGEPVVIDTSKPNDTSIPWVSAYAPSMSMTSEASVTFNPDGTIATASKPFGGSTNMPPTWGTPNTDNWVKCTEIIGSVNEGTVGSWQKLDVARTWAVKSSSETKEVVVKIDVASDATFSTIVSSTKLTLKLSR